MADNFAFKNANVFQADSAQGQSQAGKSIALRCPHCRKNGSFQTPSNLNVYVYGKIGTSIMHGTPREASMTIESSIRICPDTACNGIVLVISNGRETLSVSPPELIDFSIDNLPARCAKTISEAIACHGVGAHRAAVMMVRRLLEEICDEDNAEGNNLHKRLEVLKSLIVLPDALFEAMFELKLIGNDAAHVEARSYDEIGREEAADAIEIAKEILKARYQLKGLLGRLQARKAAIQ
jgi:hypothetical protein